MSDERLKQLVSDVLFDCMCHNMSADQMAEAAIDLIRNEVLEEAALAVKKYQDDLWESCSERSNGEVDVIRALKEKV